MDYQYPLAFTNQPVQGEWLKCIRIFPELPFPLLCKYHGPRAVTYWAATLYGSLIRCAVRNYECECGEDEVVDLLFFAPFQGLKSITLPKGFLQAAK